MTDQEERKYYKEEKEEEDTPVVGIPKEPVSKEPVSKEVSPSAGWKETSRIDKAVNTTAGLQIDHNQKDAWPRSKSNHNAEVHANGKFLGALYQGQDLLPNTAMEKDAIPKKGTSVTIYISGLCSSGLRNVLARSNAVEITW